MTAASTGDDRACRLAREAIQARLDGQSLDEQQRAELAAHLSACEACSAYRTELRSARRALRAMPVFELPTEVRKQVESATVARTRRIERWSRGFSSGWRAGAAAAVLAVVVGGTWWMGTSREPAPSDAELAQAAEQLELVLGLTSRALATVERATVQDVLRGHVLPAMERTPLGWPATTIDTGEADVSPENGSIES